MNKKSVLSAVETTVDVATVGGLSLTGIGAVLGTVLLSPIILGGTLIGGAVIGLVYCSVKDDFQRMYNEGEFINGK